jgi:uncharacterized protein (DUF2062 family)
MATSPVNHAPSPDAAVAPFRPVIVAPTFNHAQRLGAFLPALIERARTLGLAVIALDDGSTDQTATILADVRANAPSALTVLRHATNRGKAAALRTAFDHASSQGFSHALTIDTDGQHDPADIAPVLRLARAHPGTLIVGARPRTMPGYPLGSRLGRAISNFWVWAESGQRVTDSQSGLRVYPLAIERALNARAARYGYETEVLTRAGWAGVPAIEQPINCTYTLDGGRITHFRPTRDTLAAAAMHWRLWHRSLLPGSPAGPPRADAPDHLGTTFRRTLWFFSPKRLWTMIRGDHAHRERFAASVAWGVMMAFAPLYGIKTIACLALAARLRLHPLVLIGTSSLCTPPLGFVFIAASVTVGHLALRGGVPDLSSLDPRTAGAFHAMGGFLLDWLVGSVIAGALAALATYWLIRLLLLGRPQHSRDRSRGADAAIASPRGG